MYTLRLAIKYTHSHTHKETTRRAKVIRACYMYIMLIECFVAFKKPKNIFNVNQFYF